MNPLTRNASHAEIESTSRIGSNLLMNGMEAERNGQKNFVRVAQNKPALTQNKPALILSIR